LDRTEGPTDYHRDPSLQKNVIDHYRYNLARMVEIARSAGAKIIFVTPACSLRGWSPFKSEHSPEMSESQRSESERILVEAKAAVAAKNWNEAIALVDRGTAIDPRHAEMQFLRGRTLDGLSRFDEALSAYEAARNEDVCPLRALSPMVEAVREIAKTYDAPLVDFDKFTREHSPQSIPGDELFRDHVHPTIEGNLLLASRLIDKMHDAGLIRLESTWGPEAIDRVKTKVLDQIGPEQQAAALRNLSKTAYWSGKFELSAKYADEAIALSASDPESHYRAGVAAQKNGDWAAAARHFRDALAEKDVAVTRIALGGALEQLNQVDLAMEHYRRAVALADRPTIKAQALMLVGGTLRRGGHAAEALDWLERAVATDGNYAPARNELAIALYAVDQPAESLVQFRAAIKLEPPGGDPRFRLARAENMARILATSSDPTVRDGKEAIHYAQQIVEATDYRVGSLVDLLAAAYAEAGDFDRAIELATQAIALAEGAGEARLANAIRSRIKLYRQGEAFYEKGR
jgi:tetratricopeptide (TPR) repeat protein